VQTDKRALNLFFGRQHNEVIYASGHTGSPFLLTIEASQVCLPPPLCKEKGKAIGSKQGQRP